MRKSCVVNFAFEVTMGINGTRLTIANAQRPSGACASHKRSELVAERANRPRVESIENRLKVDESDLKPATLKYVNEIEAIENHSRFLVLKACSP